MINLDWLNSLNNC